MGITEAVAAIEAALAGITDEDVPAQPPDMIGAYPALIVYPQPETWVFSAHTGENGRPLVSGEHTIVVEWHTALSDLAEAVKATTPVADAIAEALFAAFHADRVDGTLTLLRSIRCERYGELGWGTDKTFGVRYLVGVTILEEI